MDRLKFDLAIEDFNHVVQNPNAPPNAKAGSYLWLGKIYDSAGKRDQALRQYDMILALDCDPDYKSQAQKFKRTAFKSEK
jgi:tetratricopeptide (TPR) repeat protein